MWKCPAVFPEWDIWGSHCGLWKTFTVFWRRIKISPLINQPYPPNEAHWGFRCPHTFGQIVSICCIHFIWKVFFPDARSIFKRLHARLLCVSPSGAVPSGPALVAVLLSGTVQWSVRCPAVLCWRHAQLFLPSSRSSVWQFGRTRGVRSIRRNYRLAVFPWQQDTVSVRQNQTQALGLILKKKGPPQLLLPCHPLLFAPPRSFLLPLSTCLISLPLTEPVHREEQFGSLHAGSTQHSAACTNTLKPNLPGKLL